MRHFSDRALLTDLYELNMLQACFAERMNETAVLEFFVRHLPPQRNFLMAAGLEQLVVYLLSLHFDEDDLVWLHEYGKFSDAFIDSLQDFGFTGDVDAMPEATIFFADEPVVRITAPLREAQFIESRVINILHYQTLVASKAARMVLAAQGTPLIDFGLRRAHGAEAALWSARASYIAGFAATATTIAATTFDIPVAGTMAHSFVQAHETETAAFNAFAHAFPANTTLLIDTYDTEMAAHQVVHLARHLREQEGIQIKAVRLNSGDLSLLSHRVRAILDEGGCREIDIVASGNLDEYAVQDLVSTSAPITGFGVGTRMNTSSDAPYLDCAYKLVEYAGRARRKRSYGKAFWPGRKQVFRQFDAQGKMQCDTLTLQHDAISDQALLQPVLRGGRMIAPPPSLLEIRSNARSQLATLPSSLRQLAPAVPAYPITIAPEVRALASAVDASQHAAAEAECMRWGINMK
jgi:nicotinate phosphoribosyltransferase